MNSPQHFMFRKYQGAGNDFILVDNRSGNWNSLPRSWISKICDRRFGVGGDGLILLNAHPEYDFEMKNYNPDGGECSMCGNGARTLVQFAIDLGIKKDRYRFLASDGEHQARVETLLGKPAIAIQMQNVAEFVDTPAGTFLNTGSPHLVVQSQNVMELDVRTLGRNLRNSPMFLPGGVNVNFAEPFAGQHWFVRTFERGVEDETLSCGTGVIAVALVANRNLLGQHQVQIQTRGGTLQVQFKTVAPNRVEDIWLIGPAELTFEGNYFC